MCVNYIKKKKRNTPHTHMHTSKASIFLTSHTCTSREWSKRTGKWTNQKRERYLNWFFSYLLYYLLYKRNANAEGGVAQSPSVIASLSVMCVYTCVCDLQLFNFDADWKATRVCVCVWVDKLISFSYYAVVAVPAHYVTNTCATHSWVPAATSHAMNTHAYIHM